MIGRVQYSGVIPISSAAPFTERVAWLQSRLDAFRKKLSVDTPSRDDPEFTNAMGEFLDFIRIYEDTKAFDVLAATGNLAEYRSVFGPAVLRFIESIESRLFSELMSKQSPRADKMSTLLGENRWGAYNGMQETFRLFDHSSCRRFLLIGCGPVPDSLFYLHDNTEVESIVGVDKNAEAVRMANLLVAKYKLGKRIRIEENDACEIDCRDYDIICCSAFITPRRKSLARIVSTAKPGSMVIVRDPAFMGTLLFERMLEAIPPQLELLAESPTARGKFMLKYHIFRVVTELAD